DGTDVFVIESDPGTVDTILDFEPGLDMINIRDAFSEYNSIADLNFRVLGNDTYLYLDTKTVLLKNFTNVEVLSDFDFGFGAMDYNYENYFDVVSVAGFHDRLREYAPEPRAGYLRSRRQIKGRPAILVS
ncbi:MAG: hypothetical protein HN941_05180, partial [Proteobacteria bacterium]|nr:hypothetical protein [Pseudomonadota bacterium]